MKISKRSGVTYIWYFIFFWQSPLLQLQFVGSEVTHETNVWTIGSYSDRARGGWSGEWVGSWWDALLLLPLLMHDFLFSLGSHGPENPWSQWKWYISSRRYWAHSWIYSRSPSKVSPCQGLNRASVLGVWCWPNNGHGLSTVTDWK